MRSRWSDQDASGFVARYGERWGEDLALRTYSGRLVGAEPELVLHGGGNTSVKTLYANMFGESRAGIHVKASGADLSLIEPDGHVGLDLDHLRRLRSLPELSDEAMGAELQAQRFAAQAERPSLETLAHAFIAEKFIDHTHADSILALTNQVEGEVMVREALGEDVIVLEYVEPGFELARRTADAYEGSPDRRAMVWMHHGLLAWGSTARDCYETTIDLVTRAERYLARKASRVAQPSRSASLEVAERRLISTAPVLRGLLARPTMGEDRPMAPVVLAPLVSSQVLAFLDSPEGRETAVSPPLTTDHLVRTKALPLWIESPAYDDEGKLREQLEAGLSSYRASYEAYLERHRERMPAGLRPFDPFPRVVLLPGLGAVIAARNGTSARIARDITSHTLKVKAQVAAMGRYRGLNEALLFDMEYRGFQHDKLGPREVPPLEGHVALVTGAAGAIGSGICLELLEQGCHVAVTDLPGERLDTFVAELEPAFGARILGVGLDVSDPGSVARGFERAVREWGGVDLLVVNAGAASVAPLARADLESFRRLEKVNVEGTLLLIGEAARHFERQGTGGDIVLVSSKNVFSPGAGMGAYSATKAAAHQLARIASLELAPLGVRVNMVAPDGVFSAGPRRSGLWEEIGADRMRARGLDESGLEEYYRSRNLLKARITARHVAKAVLFFATRQVPVTGVTLPVDGGLPDATPR